MDVIRLLMMAGLGLLCSGCFGLFAKHQPPPAKTMVHEYVPYRLRPFDPMTVILRGIASSTSDPNTMPMEVAVDERGYIRLPYIPKEIQAQGLTGGELEKEIRRLYIEQNIYRADRLSVNIVIAAQSIFMKGEVRAPGRIPLSGVLTVMQAIATAGGWTEFANRQIVIQRGDNQIKLDGYELERDPTKDQILQAGDVVTAIRSTF